VIKLNNEENKGATGLKTKTTKSNKGKAQLHIMMNPANRQLKNQRAQGDKKWP
jgi:hypothetical protein